MNVLGLLAFHHDSAACLVADGEFALPRRKSGSRARDMTPDFPQEPHSNVSVRPVEAGWISTTSSFHDKSARLRNFAL
jgi:predicted NodU family carbamoyl transferase